MSLADELLAGGHARAAWYETGRRVTVVDCRGQQRSHPLWDGNVAIVQPETEVLRGELPLKITNADGCRPWIDYRRSNQSMRVYREDWSIGTCVPFLAIPEPVARWAASLSAAITGPFVILEPIPLVDGRPTIWPFERFVALADALVVKGVPVLQAKRSAHLPIPSALGLEPTSFLHYAAAIARAGALVANDGGAVYAATALATRCIAIHNGSTDVERLGFPVNLNLGPGPDNVPCHRVSQCDHCREVLAALSVDEVLDGLKHLVTGL